MATRKTHFAPNLLSTGTVCTSKPGANAEPLLVTNLEHDVTCAKCIRYLTAFTFTPITENEIVAFVESMDFEHNPKIQDIADRYNMDYGTIEAGVEAGWLKI